MDRHMQDMKVLIVDDDTFMINLTSRILAKLGIASVSSAADGGEGLRKVETETPDIILCDLNMPGMDGLEFLRHLAEAKTVCGIVLISGEDKRVLQTATQLAKAHELNVLGSLQKPIKPDPLKVLLDKFDAQQDATRRGPLQLLTLDAVRHGLANGCIDVFYQPKVSVPGRRLVGVEALVRWRGADGRLIPPIAFLPVVEENGLIDELTEQVFRISVASAAGWVKSGLNIKVAVNFSVESLTRFELVDFLMETAREKGIDPDKLILEVTESRIMEEVTTPLEILTRLRIKGAGLAIDDFGTGASSMQQLKRIPFTELKIDRAFVAGAPHDEEARAMLESSIALARKLDLTIVAEGVETQEEWDLVESLGVEIVQGYFIAKPMPADELLVWARANGDVSA